jgi:hypothetical protein
MQTTGYQYLDVITTGHSSMHDLKTNFDKFHELTKEFLSSELDVRGNTMAYRRRPKMPDSAIIALSLCQEALGIDSENHFHSKLKSDYGDRFPDLIHITRYNARRKRLAPFIALMNRRMASEMSEGEDCYMVGSMPIPVCRNARENRLRACRQVFETAPDKGYSAVNRQYFIGYKLHAVVSLRGVVHCMDLSKASVHDLHYLNDVKYSGLNNCTLIGDKGYLSSEMKTDLFTSVGIRLQTPMRSNQKQFRPFPFVFKKCRKRIETLFSQLCDQMMMKRNYAKTFNGLSVRIISKVTATTALQMLNVRNDRPINHLKHALAA